MGMYIWLILAGIVVILKILDVLLVKSKKRRDARSYTSAGNLLTPAEQNFWLVLKQALPPSVMACPKVRLIDVLQPGKGDHSARQLVLRKHLDFVLMDVMTSRILGAIELDDSSHRRRDRIERDQFVDAAMSFAGVPLLRVTCARNYDAKVLRGQIESTLNRKQEKGFLGSKSGKSLVEHA